MPPTTTPGADVALSIIMVSYNTRDLTLAALDTLYRYPPRVPYEVIVLDNASSDGSMAAIKSRFSQVIAIDHPNNVGFAAGNNIAAESARGDRILLLNPDTEVFETTFAAIWDFAEREPQRGIWGGRTLFRDGNLNPSSCWRKMTIWSLFCIASGLTHIFHKSPLFDAEAYGSWQRDREREVDIVTGCFLLIDTPLWIRLRGFDPTFFMYAEEADLCLRARRLGARPAITPSAELIHLGGSSEITGTEKLVKTIRGRVTLMRKHWNPVALLIGRSLLLFWSFSRMVASKGLRGRQDKPGESHLKWREVWRRRAEWLSGYSAAGSTG